MWTLLKDNLWGILLGSNYVLAFIFAVFVLLKNKNPTRTISYIFILATVPFLGLLVYYFFGQDYRKAKIFEKKRVLENERIKNFREEFALDSVEKKVFEEKYGATNAKIRLLLKKNQGSVLTYDNDISILNNGEQKFKRLIEDLKAAEFQIHIEYFAVSDDELGSKIIEVICRRAQNGVKVRFIYDDVGSTISLKSKRRMTKSGVEHFPFMPVIFSNSTGKLNYRNHKKIVVIDGQIGYVGGINLEQKYDNSFNTNSYWRDTHLRLEGGSVGALQSSFLLSWNFVSNEDKPIDVGLFPKSNSAVKEPTAIQITHSGPDSDWPNIMEALFCGITMAKERIYITTPYFIPNDSMLTALTTTSRSGVDVRIMIPYKSDSWAAQYATDSYIEECLRSGVKIYRYKKGFIHAKTLAIDNQFSSIGTANFDYRSFSINFEINAIVYSENVNKQLAEMFKVDLEECEEVELSRWEKRSMARKFQESLSRLLAPLL